MKLYITKRILHSFFVMWMVATVVFVGLRYVPGGPLQAMYGLQTTPEMIEAMEREMGLHLPVYQQYLVWMQDLLLLDLGTSLVSGEDVNTILMQATPRTLSIAVVGVVVGFGVAIPAGIISALYKNSPVDYVATVIAFAGLSMPAFFIGILLAIVVGVWLGLLPVVGYTPLGEGFIPWLRRIILPGVAVGFPYAAIIMRMMRSSLLDVQGAEYMKTARAKGLSGPVRLYKHALQNAMLSVVTIAGIQIALILTGSVTVEIVFGIQGLGNVLVSSILNRDFPVVQGVILIIAAIMVFTVLMMDILYTFIDPRIRYGGEH